MEKDIRWIQRFNNFKKALSQFEDAITLSQTKELSNLEKQGLIQAFEFTHELAWNVLKDYFEYQGETSVNGSRDATRLAFQRSILKDGNIWMEMIKSRNKTSHTYNEEIAESIFKKASTDYFLAFNEFKIKIQELIKKEELF